jgi:hypothetical protein
MFQMSGSVSIGVSCTGLDVRCILKPGGDDATRASETHRAEAKPFSNWPEAVDMPNDYAIHGEAIAEAMWGMFEAAAWPKEKWLKKYGRGDGADDDRYVDAEREAKQELGDAIVAALKAIKP